MTDGELFTFIDVFKGVHRVFGKRMTEGEEAQTHRDYFRALRRFSLEQVKAGAEVWLQRGKYFPKPAEWIDSIPKPSAHAVSSLAQATQQQAQDARRAEQMRYEGQPCRCAECVESGVAERRTRFVPLEDANGDVMQALDGERVMTLGKWIHGYELARWYQAQADFYHKYRAKFGKLPKFEGAA